MFLTNNDIDIHHGQVLLFVQFVEALLDFDVALNAILRFYIHLYAPPLGNG